MPRFVCAGDIHLGAGADLGLAPGERLAEQEAVLEQIVATANELEAPLVWLGDAWQNRRPTPAEILAFRRPLRKLNGELIGIAGNHDLEAFERPTGYDLLSDLAGDDQAIATAPGILRVSGASFCRLPWAPPGRLVALEEGGDRDALNHRLAEGLVEIARGLFARAGGDGSNWPRILLAHWSVGGAETTTGIPSELFREPVLPLEDLAAIGFDAIVLGHIHKPQILTVAPAASNGHPTTIFYVGSPMPLSFGEAESEHVVWLLDTETGVFQIPIVSRPLKTVEIDLRHYGPGSDLPSHGFNGAVRDAVVKVKVRAHAEQARRFDLAALKRDLLAAGAHKVWSIGLDVERQEIARGVAMDETVGDGEALELYLDATERVAPGPLREELFDLHNTYLREANG